MEILPKKVKIKHCDGKTDVMAKCFVYDDRVEFEYRFDGMTYGHTIDINEAIKLGLVKNNKKYKVTTVIMPSIILFKAEHEWQCRDFIENRYGNGTKALLCQITKI